MRSVSLAVLSLVALCCAPLVAADPISGEHVTFNKHIAPLVFERCAGCHHPGEVAPFSLLSFGDWKKRAKQIAQVTTDRFMPPGKRGEGHGRFMGERRLSTEELSLITR